MANIQRACPTCGDWPRERKLACKCRCHPIYTANKVSEAARPPSTRLVIKA